ncbi:MAG: glycine--tRNA ligase subunit alpha [Holophagales bacterium]|nr:glycine--tRNA ligase subunit alpha [Holophagales bacterium]
MPSLQMLIQGLSGFWDEQGCAVLPPCTVEVPLGLLHPEVFFRLLDPEPWRAAFLQPICRPADARGGEHPLRGGRHHQFQVVCKGIDGQAPRELFADCARSVGLDLSQHDLRFHAHRLEVAALGAVGRGWRVELDGLALGRITFLESFAGRPVEAGVAPVVELAFGVERLAMAVLDADTIYDLPWYGASGSVPGPSAPSKGGRSKRREAERELIRYAAEVAGVDHLRGMLGELDAEARRCLDAGLPRTAYELAVRLLPILDQLDSRGGLDLRERDHWLVEIRGRIIGAAEVYAGQLADSGADPDAVSGADSDPIAAEEVSPGSAEARTEPPADGKAGEAGTDPEPPPPSTAEAAGPPKSSAAGRAKTRTPETAKDGEDSERGDAREPAAGKPGRKARPRRTRRSKVSPPKEVGDA